MPEPPVLATNSVGRRGRRARGDARTEGRKQGTGLSGLGVMGGRYTPLSDTQLTQIDAAARHVLSTVGMSEVPDFVAETICRRGGNYVDGRLTFSPDLVQEALAGFQRNFTLHGQDSNHDLVMSGNRVHVGSGGAAPMVMDLDTGRYRKSLLKDLYDAARLVDALEHIHFFSRSLVARDMDTPELLDVNTAYACLMGTRKHVFTSASTPENVQLIADMCYAIAGSEQAFRDRPFLSLNVNHVVSPLRFAEEACGVMREAARLGIPIHANSFGQLGASTPVTIAGTVMQITAETLAGMIFAWCVNPDAKITFGPRPMVTDLRTGAMSGGGGEQALLMAATTQMAHYYDLPNTCIAGAADSKTADAQSGYEKALSITLAAQAGSNAITQSCGMQASLMGCAFESYVIDNDMLGSILRSLAPIDVTPETISTELVRDTVTGDGHYLGHADTLERMESDFLYPRIADRRGIAEWEADGSLDIREIARRETRAILGRHFPNHISAEIDAYLRGHFDIRLPKENMEAS
ncbi:MAG: trimethylamine methyltransferase family protein [Alphaproteobacteria bacterium]|nr:trimethylamine methyltransferase family protein [Alphaproteobacteria bacterium]